MWGGVYRRWGKVGRWGRYVCGRGRHCACRRQRRGVHLRARSPVGTAGEAGTLRRAELGVGRGVPGAEGLRRRFFLLTSYLLTYLLTYRAWTSWVPLPSSAVSPPGRSYYRCGAAVGHSQFRSEYYLLCGAAQPSSRTNLLTCTARMERGRADSRAAAEMSSFRVPEFTMTR